MKNIIRSYFKYIIFLIATLFFFFSSTLIYNVAPLLKTSINSIGGKIILNGIIKPSFYHSFFNSMIFSIFLFGVIIFNFQKKNRLIIFSLPILTSTVIVFLYLLIFNPKPDDLKFYNVNDARIIFPEKTFIQTNGKKLYFNNIKKDYIKNVILLKNNNITFHSDNKVSFSEDKVYLSLSNQKIEIPKENYNIISLNKSKIDKSFFKLLNNISNLFIASKYLTANIFLWFATAIFIISLASFFKIKNYPLLSLFNNFIFLLLFYYIIYYLFNIYHKSVVNVFENNLSKDIFFGVIILIFGILLQLLEYILFKGYTEE